LQFSSRNLAPDVAVFLLVLVRYTVYYRLKFSLYNVPEPVVLEKQYT